MAEPKRRQVLRPVAMAALALALSGCAATHVGEDWQCPLAQGAVCTSVADADPAVPETHEAEPLVRDAPLYRPGAGSGAGAAETARGEERGCETGCGPLAWLERLFDRLGGDDGDDGNGAAVAERPGDGETAAAGPEIEPPSPAAPAPAAVAGPVRGPDGGVSASVADAAPLPASAVPSGESLREPEVLGRVWIAPFVDSGGIYREGSWVRLVIEPARWRLR